MQSCALSSWRSKYKRTANVIGSYRNVQNFSIGFLIELCFSNSMAVDVCCGRELDTKAYAEFQIFSTGID